jgi:N-acetyl-gamma-glutamyl-phosphate reductase
MIYKVAIAGASGYVGLELLRLIANHPNLELGAVTANNNAGEKLGLFAPHIPQFADRQLVQTTAENLAGHDIVFLALPHGKSAEIASGLGDTKLVIDCGADFRLESSSDWEKYYGSSHAGTWSYGLPELVLGQAGVQRDQLSASNRIAVPGCNVTAITLALAPAISAQLIDSADLVAVLSVGTSGAGKSLKPDLLASEVMGSARAYGVGGSHRHTPEIEQNLRWAGAKAVSVSFTPVLVPMSRGILAVCTAKPAPGFSFEALVAAYENAYGQERFMHVLPEGQLPTTKAVLGSNNAQLSLSYDEHAGRVSIICAIDNLVKGTAGAAIQSMNLSLGLAEESGLTAIGVAP